MNIICLPFDSLIILQKEEANQLWGQPQNIEEIARLFARFCLSNLAALPWSDQSPAPETMTIGPQLSKMNSYGFFTINSQPAVNGAPSNDKVFGWGPANGYVYQKV